MPAGDLGQGEEPERQEEHADPVLAGRPVAEQGHLAADRTRAVEQGDAERVAVDEPGEVGRTHTPGSPPPGTGSEASSARTTACSLSRSSRSAVGSLSVPAGPEGDVSGLVPRRPRRPESVSAVTNTPKCEWW